MRRLASANSQYENLLQQKKPKQQQQKKLQRAMRTGDLVTKEDIFKNFELQQKRIVFFPFIRGIS